MNNSFPRLIDGMCATLRTEVLPRLTDDYARSQVFGVINLLNTFKVRADWSAGFLLQQIGAQRQAFGSAAELLVGQTTAAPAPALPRGDVPGAVASNELLALRDEGNLAIGELLGWLDAERSKLVPGIAVQLDTVLRTAMRAEVDIELKNSPRPLFAEMSSGSEP
jgi:hypothetical protein